MPTQPPILPAPPISPSRHRLQTYIPEADAWVAWMELWAPDLDVAAQATHTNAQEAVAAVADAAAAAAGVAATNWVTNYTTGGGYATGTVRKSPIASGGDGYPYVCIQLANNRTVVPSADPLYWKPAAPIQPTLYDVTTTTHTAVPWWHYVLTNASATTLTLPASPTAGMTVWVTVGNGRIDNVIARNAQNIMGTADDMTISDIYGSLMLRFVNASLGWRII